MKNVGIICDLNFQKHPLFQSYYHSILYHYKNLTIVKNINDLNDIEILCIGDEHHIQNKEIWKNIEFINECNNNNIIVIIFNNERIMDSDYFWNVENQEYVNKFNNVYQYVSDVDDVIKLNKRFNRMPPSKYVQSFLGQIQEQDKLNKAIFIGSVGYEKRRNLLNHISNIIPIDIIESNNMTWIEYIHKLAKYKFVISPFGNAHFFPMRFYEILLAKSIPIQEVKNNTLKYYDIESQFDDCIFFENISELKNKINNCKLNNSYNMIWLEDTIGKLLKNDNLL